MFHKVASVASAAAGTIALGYGIKKHVQKIHCDVQAVETTVSSIEGTATNILVQNAESPGKDVPQKPGFFVTQKPSFNEAIQKSRELVLRLKDEVGTPGLVIAVSVDGKTVWSEGFGLADVENRLPCHADTVMRIASISKSMTMAVVARLWQEGRLDLDKPVQDYVPTFPEKTFNKEKVSITTRQLVSHLAGIRHYKKPQDNNDENKKKKKKKEKERTPKEFYIKDRFDSVLDSLKLFQDDDLVSKPGQSYLYTTHGWTLVSAVVEAAAKQPFTKLMLEFFQVMGLKHTRLDEWEPLVYNRARYYDKDERGRLRNVPYVDNSYKWAGGGFLSTVGDLLQFGNAMLYSYQWRPEMDTPAGYLRVETLQEMWKPVDNTAQKWGRDDGYGMGWVVIPARQEYGGGDVQLFTVGHTGGAVGASSALLIVPTVAAHVPSGVTVAIMVNLEGIGLQHLARRVAANFCES